MRNESAGIQFEPAHGTAISDVPSSFVDVKELFTSYIVRTAAEDPDVVDLEEEGTALLIDQFILHDERTPECELLGLRV